MWAAERLDWLSCTALFNPIPLFTPYTLPTTDPSPAKPQPNPSVIKKTANTGSLDSAANGKAGLDKHNQLKYNQKQLPGGSNGKATTNPSDINCFAVCKLCVDIT
jgi:hypothetical protein